MQSATIAGRTLEIDGMSGDACVQKVTGALKGVQGVETHSVEVGTAKIGADQAGCNAACAAIGIAGFKAREGAGTSDHNASTRATPKAPTEHKGGNQSCCAPTQNPASHNAGMAGTACDAKGAEGRSDGVPHKLAGATN